MKSDRSQMTICLRFIQDSTLISVDAGSKNEGLECLVEYFLSEIVNVTLDTD